MNCTNYNQGLKGFCLGLLWLMPFTMMAQSNQSPSKKVTVEVGVLGGASGSPSRGILDYQEPIYSYPFVINRITNGLGGIELRPRFGKRLGARLGFFYAPTTVKFYYEDAPFGETPTSKYRLNTFDVSLLGDIRLGNKKTRIGGLINGGVVTSLFNTGQGYRKLDGQKWQKNESFSYGLLDKQRIQIQLGGGIEYRIPSTKFTLSTEIGARQPITSLSKIEYFVGAKTQTELFAQGGVMYRLSM